MNIAMVAILSIKAVLTSRWEINFNLYSCYFYQIEKHTQLHSVLCWGGDNI